MSKKALVLGGGGAKGSYQMGVWKALREHEQEFDIIVGTSIGALNGAMIAQNDFETADELWNTIEYKKIFGEERGSDLRNINSTLDMVKFALSDAVMEGRADSSLLEQLVKDAVDEKRIRSSKSRFGLVTVEIPLLRPVTPMIEDIPEGMLYRYLMASSACFPVFSPYEIDGVRYIDGGYYDNVPINLAIAAGAQEIIAVDLDGVGFTKHPKTNENQFVMRIYSNWDLGAVFDFDQNIFARNRKLGYFETLKAFGEKEGYHYTFALGECSKNLSEFEDSIELPKQRIAALLRRPMARTITAVERDETLEALSCLDCNTDSSELLCRMAETAGVVYGISPEKEYTFDGFNRTLLRRFHSQQQFITIKEGLFAAEDIRRVIASVLEFKDSKNMSAAMTRLMQAQKYDEAIKLLSPLISREYIAAEYIGMLLKKGQES